MSIHILLIVCYINDTGSVLAFHGLTGSEEAICKTIFLLFVYTWLVFQNPATHTHAHAHARVRTRTHTHTHTHTLIQRHTHSYTDTDTHTHMHSRKCTCTHTHIHTHTHTHAHTHTYTHTQSYTHTHAHAHTHTNVHTHIYHTIYENFTGAARLDTWITGMDQRPSKTYASHCIKLIELATSHHMCSHR